MRSEVASGHWHPLSAMALEHIQTAKDYRFSASARSNLRAMSMGNCSLQVIMPLSEFSRPLGKRMTRDIFKPIANVRTTDSNRNRQPFRNQMFSVTGTETEPLSNIYGNRNRNRNCKLITGNRY